MAYRQRETMSDESSPYICIECKKGFNAFYPTRCDECDQPICDACLGYWHIVDGEETDTVIMRER